MARSHIRRRKTPDITEPKEGFHVTPEEKEIWNLQEEVKTLRSENFFRIAMSAVISDQAQHLQMKNAALLSEVARLQNKLEISRREKAFQMFFDQAEVQLYRDAIKRKEEVWKAKHCFLRKIHCKKITPLEAEVAKLQEKKKEIYIEIFDLQ